MDNYSLGPDTQLCRMCCGKGILSASHVSSPKRKQTASRQNQAGAAPGAGTPQECAAGAAGDAEPHAYVLQLAMGRDILWRSSGACRRAALWSHVRIAQPLRHRRQQDCAPDDDHAQVPAPAQVAHLQPDEGIGKAEQHHQMAHRVMVVIPAAPAWHAERKELKGSRHLGITTCQAMLMAAALHLQRINHLGGSRPAKEVRHAMLQAEIQSTMMRT